MSYVTLCTDSGKAEATFTSHEDHTTELKAKITELEDTLVTANFLIEELEDHEGAEGFSQYLQYALDNYHKGNK
jgi:hypothetical protein